MIKVIILVSLAVISSLGVSVRGGETTPLTLPAVIARARANSVDAEVAAAELRSAYWAYRSYRSDLLPELSFAGTIPAYRQLYTSYMNEQGEYSFVGNNYLQMQGELRLTQSIWLTGGTVSVSTSLDFMRQLSGDPYNRYLSVPVALTLSQPLFGVNNVKWNRRIEPVRYREAKAAYMSATEDVAVRAIGYYFSLLMARENRNIASQNLENADKLYAVAVEKREMGQISKNDLLQMELNLLEARAELTTRESEERAALFQLSAFLDMEEEQLDIAPDLPETMPDIEIGFAAAYEKAIENNSFAPGQLRRQLEADRAVAEAKGDLRKINIYAQIGYTGTASDIAASYRGLHDNQIVEIGIEIPLVDWGKRRGKVKVAESNRKVVESRLRQEAQTFRQDLFLLVERFSNQSRQLQLAARSDQIAAARYATNVETYLIGRLSTLDLNDSRTTKDESRRAYINELYYYWLYYYQLRSLTLWDFATDSPISTEDFSAIL